MKKAVVCPVYDEGEVAVRIGLKLRSIFDVVVIVDDGSPSPVTVEGRDGIVVLRHPVNMGKGRALDTGFRYCLGAGANVIATIDGDGEHDPEAFQAPIALYRGEGVVNLSRAKYFSAYPLFRRIRNVVFSRLVSSVVDAPLRDTQSGMRLFSRQAVGALVARGTSRGYAVETETLLILGGAGFDIVERDMTVMGAIRLGKRYPSLSSLVSDMRVFSLVALAGLARTFRNRAAMPGNTRRVPDGN